MSILKLEWVSPLNPQLCRKTQGIFTSRPTMTLEYIFKHDMMMARPLVLCKLIPKHTITTGSKALEALRISTPTYKTLLQQIRRLNGYKTLLHRSWPASKTLRHTLPRQPPKHRLLSFLPFTYLRPTRLQINLLPVMSHQSRKLSTRSILNTRISHSSRNRMDDLKISPRY